MKNLKKLMSVILTVAMLLSLVATSVGAATFADVEEDNAAYEAIEVMAALEILEGKEEGNFDPEANIKRSEFAAVICRAMNQEAAAAGSASVAKFSDVASNHWAAGYINWAAGQGIVNGMGDGTFAPDANVTYEQAVAMIVRAMGFEPLALKRGGFPTGYMVIAASYKVTNGVAMNPANGAATRAGVAQLVYNALDAATMEEGFGANIYGGTMYNIYDGKANDKATLLSRYHGIYVVDAKVMATIKSQPSLYKEKTGLMQITLNITDNNGYAKEDLLEGKWKSMFVGDDEVFRAADKTIISLNEADADYLGYNVKAFVTLNEDDDVVLVAMIPDTKGLDSVTINNVMAYVEKATVANPSASAAAADAVTFEYWEDLDDYKAEVLDVEDLGAVKVYVNGEEKTDLDDKKDAILDIKSSSTAEVTLTGSDEKFDSIFITSYTYSLVEKVDAERMKITTKRGTLDFTENGQYLSYNFYKDGEAITLADIQPGDLLNIVDGASNASGKRIADFYVTSNVVEGTISSTSGTGINTVYTIDGEEYYGVNTNLGIEAGDTGAFTITIDGRIVNAEVTSSFDGNYALVLGIGAVDIYTQDGTDEGGNPVSAGDVKDGSFNAYYQLELLTKDNVVKVYNVASTIKVEQDHTDGVLKNKARNFTVGGKSNGVDQKTLFVVNGDSDAGAMNLAEAIAANTNQTGANADKATNLDKLFITFKADGDTITHISFPSAVTGEDFTAEAVSAPYQQDRNRLGALKLTDSTFVFFAERELVDENGAGTADDEYTLTKDSAQVYTASRINDEAACVGTAFAVNKDKEIGALALTQGIDSVINGASLAMVINTSSGLNAANEPADVLNVMVGGEIVPYAVSSKYAAYDATDYSKGDVVQIATDAAGEIDEIKMVYDFTLNGQASNGTTSYQFDGTADEKVQYVIGVVVEHDNGGIEIKYGSAASAKEYFAWNLSEDSANTLYTVSKGDNSKAIVAKNDVFHIEAYLDTDNEKFVNNPFLVVAKVDDRGDIVDIVAYEFSYADEASNTITDMVGKIS